MVKKLYDKFFNFIIRIVNNKIVKHIFKRVCLIISLFFIILIISKFNIPTDIFIVFFSSFFILMLAEDFLKVVQFYVSYIDKKRLLKRYEETNLYSWTESVEINVGNIYENLMKIKIKKNDTVGNLNLIKEVINEECSGNINNLRILKAYIDSHISLNVLSNTWSIITSLIVTIFGTVLSKMASTESFIDKINKFINNTNDKNQIEFNSFIITLINYGTFTLLLCMLLITVWYILTREKNKLKLISKIIEVAILEKESDLKKDSNI